MAKMEFPTVNKFLFYCGLETGGFVLGWISAVVSGIVLLIQGHVLIFSMILYWSASIVIYMLLPCLVLFASINLIRGTLKRNHAQMRPFLIMMIVGLALDVVYICSNRSSDVQSIVESSIGAIILVYFIICIYSLYEKTKKASFNAGTANNQTPANLYPAQSVVIYSTQPTNNDGGMIYDQKEANHPVPVYPNQPPSYPGFVNTLSPDNSVIVVTSGKE